LRVKWRFLLAKHHPKSKTCSCKNWAWKLILSWLKNKFNNSKSIIWKSHGPMGISISAGIRTLSAVKSQATKYQSRASRRCFHWAAPHHKCSSRSHWSQIRTYHHGDRIVSNPCTPFIHIYRRKKHPLNKPTQLRRLKSIRRKKRKWSSTTLFFINNFILISNSNFISLLYLFIFVWVLLLFIRVLLLFIRVLLLFIRVLLLFIWVLLLFIRVLLLLIWVLLLHCLYEFCMRFLFINQPTSLSIN
jgi:ABC-type multidrug transport system fused ATPase/permease subunit